MTFSAEALAAFATVSAASLASGDLDLLDASGNIVATFDLGAPTSNGATTTMSGFPRTSLAASGNTIASARYRTSSGGNWKTGMTVGLANSGAQVILSSLTPTVGQNVTINSATLAHTS